MKKIWRKIAAFGMALVLTAGAAVVNGAEITYASDTVTQSFAPTGRLDGDYGYNDLAQRSNGAARQEFYMMLEEVALSFRNNAEDWTSTTIAKLNVTELGLSNEELAETYYVMYYDNPQYYWLSNTFTANEVSGSVIVAVKIHEEYLAYATRNKCNNMLDAAFQEYDAAVAGLSSCYDVAIVIHDKLIQDIEYAYQSDGVTPSEEAYAHSIIGVIDDNLASAVCEGYAKMYQLLLNRYGIENIVVCGIGNGDRHAWNLVQMDDDRYYCTDVTWDDTNIPMENGVDISSYQYFNASSQDFDVLHTAHQAGEDVAYYAVLPDTSESYDYTHYAKHSCLISENVVLKYVNGIDTELEFIISNAIEAACAEDSNRIYLYISGADTEYLLRYSSEIRDAIDNAASSVKDTSSLGYDIYMLSDECIIEFGETPDDGEYTTGIEAISLYQDGRLIGEYVCLDSVLTDMTEENGNYVVNFDPELQNKFYISSVWSKLPKVGSIVFGGGKENVGTTFYTTAIEIKDDLIISGDVTFDFIQLVSETADLYLKDAVVYLDNYSRLGPDIYAENSQIIVLPEGRQCELSGDLRGDCDITIIGSNLIAEGELEINRLVVESYKTSQSTVNGKLYFWGSVLAEDYNYSKINEVISAYSPFKFSFNNHDLWVGEIGITGDEWFDISFADLREGDMLPKISVGTLSGVEKVSVRYGLSSKYLNTDSDGQETGSTTVTCDKSILKNNEGLFLTCSDIDKNKIEALYYSDVESGELNVVQIGDSFYVKNPGECEGKSHSMVTDAAVAPNCTETGFTEGSYCSVCGIVMSTQTVIPAIGHSEVVVVGKAATCVAGGLTDGAYCSTCGAVLAAQKVILATNQHTYNNDLDTDCNVCGYTRDVAIVTTPMYRLYNPNSGEHFYTGSVEERDMLDEAGWTYEGVAWNAPVYEGDPVYRVYNPNSGDHHYTMSQAEVDMLLAVGWNYEGVAWNSAFADNLPLYRLYNPNADCGSHHYTGSTEERDFLVSVGWEYEGVGWFGMLK